MQWYARLVQGPCTRLSGLTGRLPVSHANLSFDFKVKRGMRGASHQPPYWNPVWLSTLEPAAIGRLFWRICRCRVSVTPSTTIK